MATPSKKQPNYQQIAKRMIDTLFPDAEPKKKPGKAIKKRRSSR